MSTHEQCVFMQGLRETSVHKASRLQENGIFLSSKLHSRGENAEFSRFSPSGEGRKGFT